MNTKRESEPHRKVVVVGAGSVGATYCYSLAQSGLADEIILIDRNMEPETWNLKPGTIIRLCSD